MARLPELNRENRIPCVMRHPLPSRIPPTIGFHRKTTQTRRFRAERGFLRCDRGWSTNSQPTRPRRRSVGKEETTTLARSSLLRVQCRCSALARFRWLNFGDQQDTQSRNRSDERKMHETRTRTRNAGSLEAAGPFQPRRSDPNFPLMTLPQEVMTSGRTVEIANGQ